MRTKLFLMTALVAANVFWLQAQDKKEEFTRERLERLLKEKASRLKDYEVSKYSFALKTSTQADKELKWAISRLEENVGSVAPKPQKAKWWMPRHEAKLKEIAQSGGKIDIVFMGDSISHGWEGWNGKGPGHKVLAEIRQKHSVLVAGFGGDRTYNAIWRAQNGELDGYEAKVVCILIGCNNWADYTAEEIAEDIKTLVGIVKEKQPRAKILLMPLLPRADAWAPLDKIEPENNFKSRKNEDVNRIIAKLPDGERVVWFDLREQFKGAPKTLMPDRLHPGEAGYRIWWDEMRKLIEPVREGGYKIVKVEGEPFEMPPLKEFVYPSRRFVITDYGAKDDGSKCTEAIAKAMAACSQSGGGYVVVPKGKFLTGKIHFRSNVNLHLEEGAVLEFSDEKEDYLPAVHTTWEGVECWNTSPLIYAYECENIAITGPGLLTARVEGWYARAEPKKGTPEYAKRRPAMKNAWLTQYLWGATNAVMSARNLLKACPEADLRPQFIQFNRCRNILLEGFTLRNSPFWCIHLYLSQNVIARRLDLRARKHNNDAFDIDMTSEVLVENCVLDNADDGFTMKAGRNQDAWRLNTPTRNVVVRNCHVKFAHTLLGLGSELSGGLENISLHDCTAEETYNFCFLKTNQRRGGFVKNIHLSNVSVKKTYMTLAIDTDVMYQYRDFPTFEVRPTEIDGIFVDGISCGEVLTGIEVKGDETKKIRNLSFKNITIGEVKDTVQIGTWKRSLPAAERGRPIDICNAVDVELESVKIDCRKK